MREAGRLPVDGPARAVLHNAVIESWHSTLEFELRALERFASRQRLGRVSAWIQDYDTRRRHSTLGMRSQATMSAHYKPEGRLIARAPCRRCSPLSRLFLPGQGLCASGTCSYREARTDSISQVKVSTLSGNPRPVTWATKWACAQLVSLRFVGWDNEVWRTVLLPP